MSEFFRALGQAERDRALRQQGSGQQPTPPVEQPMPVAAPTEDASVPAASSIAPASPPPPAFETTPVARRRARRPVDVTDAATEGLDGHLVSLVTPATFEAEQ